MVVSVTLQQIRENVERVNVQGKHPYELSFSMGYDHLDLKASDTEQFLRAIDNQMYAEKKKYYEDMAMKK